MRFKKFALLLVASFVGLSGSAVAQGSDPDRSAGACFEIVVPQRNMPPARPLLFNKCTGATWLLVRHPARAGNGERARLVYRWVSLEADRPLLTERGEPAGTPSAPANGSGRPGQKCFEFTGRRFCE
jgi:hypothetical protein